MNYQLSPFTNHKRVHVLPTPTPRVPNIFFELYATLASNFHGLSTTKRHTRANGINAGGINSGAYCPGVLSMVLMKVCLGFFVGSLCITGSFAHFGVSPL